MPPNYRLSLLTKSIEAGRSKLAQPTINDTRTRCLTVSHESTGIDLPKYLAKLCHFGLCADTNP